MEQVGGEGTYGERVDRLDARIAGLASQREGLYREAKVKAREMRLEGWSTREISAALGIPRSTVGLWTVGLMDEDGTTSAQVATAQKILDLHMAGRDTASIGRAVGHEASHISWVLRGMQDRWPHLKMKRGQKWLYSGPRQSIQVTADDVASWRRSNR